MRPFTQCSYRLRHEQYLQLRNSLCSDSNYTPFIHVNGPSNTGKTSVVCDILNTFKIPSSYINLQTTIKSKVLSTILDDLAIAFNPTHIPSCDTPKHQTASHTNLPISNTMKPHSQYSPTPLETISSFQNRDHVHRGPEYVVVLDHADNLLIDHKQQVIGLASDSQLLLGHFNEFAFSQLSHNNSSNTKLTSTLGSLLSCHWSLAHAHIRVTFVLITTSPSLRVLSPLSLPISTIVFPSYTPIQTYHIISKLYVFLDSNSHPSPTPSRLVPRFARHPLAGLINSGICVPIPIGILALRVLSELLSLPSPIPLQQQGQHPSQSLSFDWLAHIRRFPQNAIASEQSLSHRDFIYNYLHDDTSLFCCPPFIEGCSYSISINADVDHLHPSYNTPNCYASTATATVSFGQPPTTHPNTIKGFCPPRPGSNHGNSPTTPPSPSLPVIRIPILSLLSISFVDLIIRNECIPSASRHQSHHPSATASPLTNLNTLFLQCYFQLCFAGFEQLVRAIVYYITHTPSCSHLQDDLTRLHALRLSMPQPSPPSVAEPQPTKHNASPDSPDSKAPSHKNKRQRKAVNMIIPSKDTIVADSSEPAPHKAPQQPQLGCLDALDGWYTFADPGHTPDALGHSLPSLLPAHIGPQGGESLSHKRTGKRKAPPPESHAQSPPLQAEYPDPLHNDKSGSNYTVTILDLVDLVVNNQFEPGCIPSSEQRKDGGKYKTPDDSSYFLPGVIPDYTFPRTIQEVQALALQPVPIPSCLLVPTDNVFPFFPPPSTQQQLQQHRPKQPLPKASPTEPFQLLYEQPSPYTFMSISPTTYSYSLIQASEPCTLGRETETEGEAVPASPPSPNAQQQSPSTATPSPLISSSFSDYLSAHGFIGSTQASHLKAIHNLTTFSALTPLALSILIAGFLASKVSSSLDSTIFNSAYSYRVQYPRRRGLPKVTHPFYLDRLLVITRHVLMNANKLSTCTQSSDSDHLHRTPFDASLSTYNASIFSSHHGKAQHETLISDSLSTIHFAPFFNEVASLIQGGYLHFNQKKGNLRSIIDIQVAESLSKHIDYPIDNISNYFG